MRVPYTKQWNGLALHFVAILGISYGTFITDWFIPVFKNIGSTLFTEEEPSEKENTPETTFLLEEIAMDSSECVIHQVQEGTNDFVPVLQCRWDHPGIGTYAPPMFADVDGDGKTEIVVMLEHSPDGFAIIDPETCEAEHIVAIGEEIWLKDGGVVLGDVDHNGIADIFIPGGTRVQRWQYNPATMQVEKVWETPHGVANGERAHLDILDINQDGTPEIIPNIGQMVDAVTGHVYPGQLPMLHQQGKGLFAFTADALPGPSPDGQSIVELIYGTSIYRYDFNNQYWAQVSSLPGYYWGSDACVAIADMDLDGDVDAIISNYDESGPGEALIWDLQTDEILGGDAAWDYPSWKGSRMMIANMDDDPYPEMAMTSRFTMFAVDDIVTTGGFGNIVWLDITTDESGHTELTSFDFNADGKYEIAYRDETHLRIFSGMGTGVPTGEYPSGPSVLLDSGIGNSCQSFTGMEYPTIGDVDNDDEAEMVATCRNSLNVYKSGSLPWRDATQVWNTNAFNVTCVNQDGTIPADPIENYTLYNNFLSQVVTGGPGDTVAIAIPDAFINIVNAENQCGGEVLLEMEICNQGAAPMPAGTPIAIYMNDPRVAATLLQTITLITDLQVSQCVVKSVQLTGIEAAELHAFAVVNDNGQHPLPYVLDAIDNGGSFPFTGITECDYTNNLADSLIVFQYASAGTEAAVICENDAFVFHGNSYTQAGTYEVILQADNGCDSLVTLTLEVINRGISYEEATICMGESFEFAGEMLNAAGIYYDTILVDGMCDSLVQFHLTVLPDVFSITYIDICEGESYVFNGESYDTAGEYADTLFNVTANGGCDSIIVLDLNVHPPVSTELNETICEGQTYIFNGQVLNETDIYQDTLESYYGCDSVVTLNLTALPELYDTVFASVCEGLTYYFGNQGYSQAGAYQQSFISSIGCDSTVTLILSLAPKYTQEVYDTICRGDSYFFAGSYYTEQGDFPKYYISEYGCDSIVTLHLFLQNPAYEEDHVTVCEGETYQFGDNEITVTQFGVYHDTFTNRFGCDSFVWMHLYPIPSFEAESNARICEGESYEWEGTTYLESGSYEQIYTASNGCDSTLTLHLAVEPMPVASIVENICEGESFQLGDIIYTEAGNYEQFFETEYCDSLVQLELIVTPDEHTIINEVLCFGESILVGNTVYSTEGTFTQNLTTVHGCDSIVEINLSILPTSNTSLEATICEGETYPFHNDTLTSTGTYEQLLIAANGCDSTVILDLQVLPEITTNLDIHLCEGESYTLGNSTYLQSGTYQDTFTAENGCDSTVTLVLNFHPSFEETVLASPCEGESFIFGDTILTSSGFYDFNFETHYGCDSLVHLQLFFLPAQETHLNEVICEGESIMVGGTVYDAPGTYTENLTGQNGCDSIVLLELNVLQPVLHEIEATICEGATYPFGNTILSEAGTYWDTLQIGSVCDSIVSLHLQVLPYYEIPMEVQLCEGESIEVGGTIYQETTSETIELVATNGCDSIIHLDLTINPIYENEINANICQGESYIFGNQMLTTAGNYEFPFQTEAGCDSLVKLQLFVLPAFYTTLVENICEGESFEMGGISYTESGFYIDTLTALNGCDSTVRLDLSVEPTVYSFLTPETICDGESVEFFGQTITTSGVYEYIAATNCDSIVVLEVTVLQGEEETIEASICESEYYLFEGDTLNSTGVYSAAYPLPNGCNRIITLHLTVFDNSEIFIEETICEGYPLIFHDNELTEPGHYQITLDAEGGCDSIVNLQLTVLPTVETSIAETICEGESVFIGEYEFTEAGEHWQTIPSLVTGCDSVVQLLLATIPPIQIDQTASICEGEVFNVGANEYTEPGLYHDVLVSEVTGCDSIITTGLTVIPNEEITLDTVICAGEVVILGNNTYDTDGTYTVTIPSVTTDCYAVVTLVLAVQENIETYMEEVICEGETVTVGNQIYYETGTYEIPLQTASLNCDSTVFLDLTVKRHERTDLDQVLCQGESITIGNEVYDTEGTHTTLLSTVDGCDSTIVLNLELLPEFDTFLDELICADANVQIGNQVFNTPGLHSVTLQAENGCDSTVYLELEVLEVFTNSIDMQICEGDSYQGHSQTGTYFDTYIASNGCDSIVRLELEVVPHVEHEYTASICDGETYDFGGSLLTTEGTYFDTIPSGSFAGCDSLITFNLVILPHVEEFYDYEICEGDSIFIAGVWHTEEGIISEELQTADGCDSLVENSLIVIPPVAIEGFGGEICLGDTVLIGVQGSDNYQWWPTEGLSCVNCPTPFASPTETTVYTVTSVGCAGLEFQTQIEVVVHQPPTLELSENQTIAIGQSATLEAVVDDPSLIETIYWDVDGKVTCPGCFDITITPESSITYTVYITDIYGCSTEADITVDVREECIDEDFVIPNMFSPNGDGQNDKFYIQTGIPMDLKWLRIYNRWGQLLFQTNDITAKWDGTFRNTPLNPGVYAYYMELICPNGEPYKKVGNVTIIK